MRNRKNEEKADIKTQKSRRNAYTSLSVLTKLICKIERVVNRRKVQENRKQIIIKKRKNKKNEEKRTEKQTKRVFEHASAYEVDLQNRE